MEHIFAKLTPLTRLAAYLGKPTSTVYNWQSRGNLPVEYEDAVVAFSRKLGREHHVTLREIADARKANRIKRAAELAGRTQ